MKVSVEPASHEPSNDASGGQRNRQLNHRFGLYQVAKRTLSAGFPCSLVRHSSTITPRLNRNDTFLCTTRSFACFYTEKTTLQIKESPCTSPSSRKTSISSVATSSSRSPPSATPPIPTATRTLTPSPSCAPPTTVSPPSSSSTRQR